MIKGVSAIAIAVFVCKQTPPPPASLIIEAIFESINQLLTTWRPHLFHMMYIDQSINYVQ